MFLDQDCSITEARRDGLKVLCDWMLDRGFDEVWVASLQDQGRPIEEEHPPGLCDESWVLALRKAWSMAVRGDRLARSLLKPVANVQFTFWHWMYRFDGEYGRTDWDHPDRVALGIAKGDGYVIPGNNGPVIWAPEVVELMETPRAVIASSWCRWQLASGRGRVPRPFEDLQEELRHPNSAFFWEKVCDSPSWGAPPGRCGAARYFYSWPQDWKRARSWFLNELKLFGLYEQIWSNGEEPPPCLVTSPMFNTYTGHPRWERQPAWAVHQGSDHPDCTREEDRW